MIDPRFQFAPIQQRQQPIGPDVTAQQPYVPQFMNITHAQMNQPQQGESPLSGMFNLGAALLAKRGLGGKGDVPMGGAGGKY